MRPTIFLGADHAGFNLKNYLRRFLVDHGYEVVDVGATELDPNDDYPKYALEVARNIKNKHALGVLLCGNAEGVCIAANKVTGVRAAVGYSVYAARSSRNDDSANIICLPARVLKRDEASRILLTFLTTSFSNAARHVRRVKAVQNIEKEN
ncbi:MAG: RpiB/LacA/LacB family sugar-phosphate isomerase [bacterium]